MTLFSFPKNQRLKGKKKIDSIFSSGKNFFAFPLKAIYTVDEILDGQSAISAMFVVPKKKIRKAVTRNLIRRRMREAFRLNKHTLIEECKMQGKQVSVVFVFASTDVAKFDTITTATLKILKDIAKNLSSSGI